VRNKYCMHSVYLFDKAYSDMLVLVAWSNVQINLCDLWFHISASMQCSVVLVCVCEVAVDIVCCVLLNRSTPLTCSMALADCQFMAGLESCMRSEEPPMTTDSLVSRSCVLYTVEHCN